MRGMKNKTKKIIINLSELLTLLRHGLGSSKCLFLNVGTFLSQSEELSSF